jgi:hypothetical protein
VFAVLRVRCFGWVRCFVSLGLPLWVAACTLLEDDFQPQLVEARAELAPDAGARETPLACLEDAECCEVIPCAAGQVCSAGHCAAVDAGADTGCEGAECPLPVQLDMPASCSDGVANQDETDVDCGGSCSNTCALGQTCLVAGDCATDAVCSPMSGRCAAPSCDDGVRDGAETATDCGGGSCPRCAAGGACKSGTDCDSAVCSRAGTCAQPSCNDGAKNGDETDVDCGGACGRDCATGRGCHAAGDCQSGVCSAQGCGPGVALCCQAPSCSDGVQNGGESSVDCGTPACGLCPLGGGCALGTQCATGFCQDGHCADAGSCTDGVRNGPETGVDCGGGRCGRCPDRSACVVPADCNNNNCDNGICISCGDAVIDGTETDFDCGGSDPACQRCPPGRRCLINSDCASNFCFNGFC